MLRIQWLHVKNMPYFKEIRDICLGAYSFDIIDDTEFVLLYDLHKSKNPDIPYWRYEKLDLEKLNDDQCKVTFRFSKNHIYDLKETLKYTRKNKVLQQCTCWWCRGVMCSFETFCLPMKVYRYDTKFCKACSSVVKNV